jgi:hypothetical protein
MHWLLAHHLGRLFYLTKCHESFLIKESRGLSMGFNFGFEAAHCNVEPRWRSPTTPPELQRLIEALPREPEGNG